MKTVLKISILLNLGLLGGLIFLLLNGRKGVAGTPPSAVVESKPPVSAVAIAPPPASSAKDEPKPFRWSQLESGDYYAYVKNLRAIGCPEPTLRAIVTADVAAQIQSRYQELDNKLSALAGGSWANQLANFDASKRIKSELQELPDEETSEINDLLGERQIATAPDLVSQSAGAPIVQPLVLQPVDLTKLNLDDSQIKAIQDLKQNFIQKIGGTNQDSKDPAYVARWQQAQPETDELMRGMIGDDAFQNYQVQALAQAQPSQTGNPPPSSPATPGITGN